MGTMPWKTLISEIKQQRVVIVLGDDLFFIDDENGNRVRVTDYVRQQLTAKFFSNNDSFVSKGQEAALVDIEKQIAHYNIDNTIPTNIHREVFNILEDKKITCIEGIKDIIASNLFPLIISTSYFPQIPSLLGIDEKRVVSNRNRVKSEDDIESEALDPDNPTMYYMFGRANCDYKKSFMVTEDDYLFYLHHWHSESRPPVISDYLKDKFLLVLGCRYPNWVFRFFWHSMKNFKLPAYSSDELGDIILLDHYDDDELRGFLSRFKNVVLEDIGSFVKELIPVLKDVHINKQETTGGQTEQVEENFKYDVFISAASEDYGVAGKIADIFRESGARVWYRDRILPGDKFNDEIISAIRNSKRFVPILSRTTLTIKDRRIFKKEWNLALEESKKAFGNPYITPIMIDNIDIEHKSIPSDFRENTDILVYNNDQLAFRKIVKKLVDKIQSE